MFRVVVSPLVMGAVVVAVSMLTSGSATAGWEKPPPEKPPAVVTCDFTTGGGWIIIQEEANDKANFGIVGGCKNNGFYGHANYVDHNSGQFSGLHVNGPVTAYLDPCIGGCGLQPGYRDLCGPASSNLFGPVFFRIRTRDFGEPGGDDRFGIKLVRQSDLTQVYLVPTRELGPPGTTGGRGNIQFHFPNPSNTGPNPPPDEFTACHMSDDGLGE